MAGYRLSGEADADLDKIVAQSIETWGQDAAKAYLFSLPRFRTPVMFPAMGRDVGFIRPGYRMIEVGEPSGVFSSGGGCRADRPRPASADGHY